MGLFLHDKLFILKNWTFFLLLLFLGTSLQAQSGLQKTKRHVDGLSIGFGMMRGEFLTPHFRQQVNNEQISREWAWSGEIAYTYFPFIFNLTGFATRFELDRFANFREVTMLHTGGEIGASVALLHNVKYFYPYVGLGYQLSYAGVSMNFLGGENEDTNVPYHSTNMSTPVYKIGASLTPFEWLRVSGEYRAPLNLGDSEKANFSIFGIQLFFKFHTSYIQ